MFSKQFLAVIRGAPASGKTTIAKKLRNFNKKIVWLKVENRGIKVKVFQIMCSLATLQDRDRNRPGVKEGCRKPMGDEAIAKIYNQLERTFIPGAISLDTEQLSIDECVSLIKQSLN